MGLLTECNLGPKDWPAVTEVVQSVINRAPWQRFGLRSSDTPGVYRTPLEVFTGHKPVRPLIRVLPVPKCRSAHTAHESREHAYFRIEYIRESLGFMHKEMQGLTSDSRKRQVE